MGQKSHYVRQSWALTRPFRRKSPISLLRCGRFDSFTKCIKARGFVIVAVKLWTQLANPAVYNSDLVSLRLSSRHREKMKQRKQEWKEILASKCTIRAPISNPKKFSFSTIISEKNNLHTWRELQKRVRYCVNDPLLAALPPKSNNNLKSYGNFCRERRYGWSLSSVTWIWRYCGFLIFTMVSHQ